MPDVPVSDDACRTALSALLDGEEPALTITAVTDHLASCRRCSTWLDEAAVVTRGVRLMPLAEADLGERVVNSVDVHLCACRTGGACLCRDCHCGPGCTCGTSR